MKKLFYHLAKGTTKPKIKFPIFDPTNKAIIFWESIKITLIILLFWWMPFELSFRAEVSYEVKNF